MSSSINHSLCTLPHSGNCITPFVASVRRYYFNGGRRGPYGTAKRAAPTSATSHHGWPGGRRIFFQFPPPRGGNEVGTRAPRAPAARLITAHQIARTQHARRPACPVPRLVPRARWHERRGALHAARLWHWGAMAVRWAWLLLGRQIGAQFVPTDTDCMRWARVSCYDGECPLLSPSALIVGHQICSAMNGTAAGKSGGVQGMLICTDLLGRQVGHQNVFSGLGFASECAPSGPECWVRDPRAAAALANRSIHSGSRTRTRSI